MTQDEVRALATKAQAAVIADTIERDPMPAAMRYSPEALQKVGAIAIDMFQVICQELSNRNTAPTDEQAATDREWILKHPPSGLSHEEWASLLAHHR